MLSSVLSEREEMKRDREIYPGLEVRTRLARQQQGNIPHPSFGLLTRGSKQKSGNTRQKFVKNATNFI
jgi:hypothetical protein